MAIWGESLRKAPIQSIAYLGHFGPLYLCDFVRICRDVYVERMVGCAICRYEAASFVLPSYGIGACKANISVSWGVRKEDWRQYFRFPSRGGSNASPSFTAKDPQQQS